MISKTKPTKARGPKLTVDVNVANKLSAEALASLIDKVNNLDASLRTAIDRKPSKVLMAIVYRLRSVTHELGDMYTQIERNNTAVESLCRMLGAAPTLQPMTADEVSKLIDQRLEERRVRELGGR